ncbi:unnamed protein product [Blepharisma stoltei]|uniref:Uncharacterized protein n=1 Tax=Blepharisma stoltei TaxID=1481888 RepID=A0AAU9IQ66_9CILI|nr:unnamed protein product [Blepharisma stoltei]
MKNKTLEVIVIKILSIKSWAPYPMLAANIIIKVITSWFPTKTALGLLVMAKKTRTKNVRSPSSDKRVAKNAPSTELIGDSL